MQKPDTALRLWARAAVVYAKGDSDKAYERLDAVIIKENDAAVERELTKEWRRLALRALLAVAFTELRAEGKIRQPRAETPIKTTDYERTTEQWRPGLGRGYPTPSEIQDDAQRALQRRWFEDYKINGMPLGDCTAREADRWAASRERDANFIRRLIEGLPDDARIRDFRTEDDAAKCWTWACQNARDPDTDPTGSSCG